MIFTAQPRVFGGQIFTHRFWGVSCTAGLPKSIDEPCAMKPPALELLPGTQLASTYFPPRCDLPRDGPHGPLHPGQNFSWHVPDFPIYSNGTKPGTLHNAAFKREVLRDRKVFESPISCRQEVFRWCIRYNTRRRHSWCNFQAPDDFEALNSATLSQVA